MKDLRRHYVPYIDDLRHLRGETRRPMVGRDTFHVLAGVDKSSSLSRRSRGGNETFPEETREPTAAVLGDIYFLQRARRIFTVFVAELFFTLPRQCKHRRVRLKTRVTPRRLNGILT